MDVQDTTTAAEAHFDEFAVVDGPPIDGHVDDVVEDADGVAARAVVPPLPLLLTASGLYAISTTTPLDARPVGRAVPLPIRREELRLDVDGRYPQMVASGTVSLFLRPRVHWIANLTRTASNTYAGAIWYTDGTTSLLPYTHVSIKVVKSFFPSQRRATVTFSAAGQADRVRTFHFVSPTFHPVDLEYDTVQGTTAVTSVDTGGHPNRPANLPVENLTIETVYRRAGFAVTTGNPSTVPMAAAGTDALWTDMEMHDAMQVHWSRFANVPQWAVWTLFAGQHAAVPSQGITPTNLGGIMFDDIGPNHRQGTAVFNDSFIASAPPADPNPAAFIARTRFWTGVHELGHTFNLAHSWEKAFGTQWIPLANEPTARSFMNYPYNVPGGQAAFYADFRYRFSDSELLFMRHAPARFVQQGNADWFDNHGFQDFAELPHSDLALELRVHRSVGSRFEFMEPVVAELKLTNVSTKPLVLDANALIQYDDMVVVIKRRGAPARQWMPFARYCLDGEPRVLRPGESMYGSLPIAAGLNGWDIAEPGRYEVHVLLRLDEYDVVSNPLSVRVLPPLDRHEEVVAQDLFTDDVGRTLAFNGTRVMSDAIDTLQTVVETFPHRLVAKHAQLALGNALARPRKVLQLTPVGDPDRIELAAAAPDQARAHLASALTDEPTKSADTLGHIDFTQCVRDQASFLAKENDTRDAVDTLHMAQVVLSDRGVLVPVVAELADEAARYAAEA